MITNSSFHQLTPFLAVEVWQDDGEPEKCVTCNGTGLEYGSDPCEDCNATGKRHLTPGWYYWHCEPGCLPESEEVGPFLSPHAALAAAKDSTDDHRN
jgi:hypothetical protein